ncbi:MAG: helix-turn-helix domain-containing protein, partial [Pseudomonadota bacterium]
MSDEKHESVSVKEVASNEKNIGSSIGDVLRLKRESLNITLADVSEKLKITPRHLESLESNQFSNITNPIFCQGYLKSYASFLGLEKEPLSDELNRILNLKTKNQKRLDLKSKPT